MTRYQKLFKILSLHKKGAFIPFVALGDPNFHLSINIIMTLIKSGSDALELGIPFSDPLADGPNIQNAFHRALNSNITVDHCFKIINIIRKTNQNIPIGLLTYTNLIFKNGINKFYKRCAQHEIDSVLIADLPIEESTIFRHSALRYKISPVFICPPNADNNLLKNIATYSQSYTYLTSRTGVTGHEDSPNTSLKTLIHNLHKYNSPPILQGFGISTPLQAKIAYSSGVSGIISGSVIANIIKNNFKNHEILLNELQNFVYIMKNSMK